LIRAENNILYNIGWSICLDILDFAWTLTCFGWTKKLQPRKNRNIHYNTEHGKLASSDLVPRLN